LGTWSTRSPAEDPIVRLILDGTVVRAARPQADSISLFVLLGARADGQKVLVRDQLCRLRVPIGNRKGTMIEQSKLRVCLLILTSLFAISVPWQTAIAGTLTPEAINTATPAASSRPKGGLDGTTVKIEILLDRAHFSPGEIDGKDGENLKKALVAFAAAKGTSWQGKWTDDLWAKLTANGPDDLLMQYTITEQDLNGPFVDRLPTKMEDMKDLRRLSYTSPREELAERFHSSEDLLAALNPNARFAKAGETIVVPRVGDTELNAKVARLEVDKTAATVKAFSQDGQLLAFYPATVGSEEKPAPSGTLKVTGVQKNPTYHYNPKYQFKGVKTRKPFTVKPGPNNPVGLVWIGLTGQGFGIHGTPDPSKVSKTESHGCVRLTNWDALQLAAVVEKGTPVEFIGDDKVKQTNASASETTSAAERRRVRGHRHR
jgi:lipoprotein-anchoring transpeptidase ErfK/SrfK